MTKHLRHILPLLALLLMAATNAWAVSNAKVIVISEPTEGGQVAINSSNSATDWGTRKEKQQDGKWYEAYKDFTFYRFASAANGYTFKGWATSATSNSVATDSKFTVTGGGAGTETYTYYAIFATLQNATGTPSFSDTKVDEYTSSTINIKHAHAGTVTLTLTEGDFSFSQNTYTYTTTFSSTSADTKTITIYFKPRCNGIRTATLSFASNNGLNSIPSSINLSANGLRHNPNSITWVEPINTDMFIGDTRTVNVNTTTDGNITYTSSDNSIMSVSGNTLTAKAVGTVTITATQAATCKYNAVSITQTFTVSDKKTPTFWLNGDPNQLTDNLKTYDIRTINITNVDANLTADYDPNLLSYTFDGSTATIQALDAGRATLKLTQPETNQIFFGERTFTFNITKYDTNTLTNDLATAYMVDDIIPEADIYTINNNEVPVQIISGNESILKFENGQLKAVGAGTTTLTVKQPATNKWVERSATKTITVHKYDITATINPNNAVWNQLVTPNPFSASTQHKFSGTTSAVTDFSVTQQNNEHIALMDATTRDIQTYYTNGQVNFLITRQEDYKYNALSQTLTLHVNQSGETCNLIIDETANADHSTGQNSNGTYSKIFTLNGIGDKLIFKYYLNGRADYNHYVTPQYSTTDTGDNFNDITTRFTTQSTTPTSSDSITLPVGTKRIRFKRTAATLGTKNVLLSNITVTRAKDLTPSDSLVILPVTSIGTPETKTFTLKWSTCADEILLTNSNPHFTLNTYRIQPTNNEGSTAIKVTCDASVVGTLRDTIVIYDQTQRIFVPVVCEVNDKFIANIKGTTAYSKKVDNTWVADFKFDTCQTTLPSDDINAPFYYTIDHDLTGNDVLNPGNKKQVISYNPQNYTITAHNAGTAVLTFIQRPTISHYTDTFRCVITVSKYDAELNWKDPVYYNDTISNYFTTTDTISTIVIVSQTDTDVAKLTNEFNPTSNNSLDLITFNKEASTTVTVSQVENYKWNGYSIDHTITPIDPSNHVTFTIDNEDEMRNVFYHSHTHNLTWSGGIDLQGGNYEDKHYIFHFTGIPDSLYFDYKVNSALTTGEDWYAEQSQNGVTWNRIWTKNGEESGSFADTINPNTQYIKLCYSGNGHGLFYNVRVTELNEFRAVEVNNHEVDVEFLNFDSIQVNTSKTMSFAFKYANAGYKVELISTDPHFTINPSSITDIGGENHGTRQIDVTYTSSVPHATNEDAMIIISDEHGHKDTVQLIASAYKLKQTLRWRADFEAVEKPLIPLNGGDISDAAYSTSGLTIKYLSNNSNVIAISSDGTTLIPMGEGEATITATQTGNELWNPAESITKTFIVTDKRLQYIIWNDPLSDLVKSDNNQTITLTARVYVQTENGQIVDSPEQTAKLTYQSANTSIVSVSGSLLTIHSVGKTTLTAHVPDTDDFAAATLTVPVIVRPETAGCEDVLLLDENGPIQFFQYSLNEIIKEAMPLDLNKGIPGYVLVEHYGESWDLAIQYYAAEIRVEESTDGGNSWNTITTIYPAEDKVNIDSIPLSRTATHIRFARNSGGQGYQFLQNIKVHPAQFIEGPDVIDFGQIHVGSREEQTFTIAYSNIKSTLSPVVSSTDVVATPSRFGECGEFGTQTIQVFWTPSQLGENMQETVTFTDFNSGMEKVVILRAQNIQKGLQQLNWDAPEIIEHCGHIHFPEKTTADLPIKWEVIEGKQYADFVDGTLTLFQNGTIQIKGSNNGSNNYEPFEKIYTFQIAINPIFMGTEDEDWNNTNNWNICRMPYEHEAVTIQASTVLTETISIAGITFAMGENGNLGSIHITSTGGLSVGAQGVTGAATDGSSIIIDNLKTGAGFLRISPAYQGTMPRATINYQTRSTLDTGANKDATWQYIGAPGDNCQFTVDYITWLYQWSEPQNWLKKTGTLTLTPFAGYAITQYGQPTYSLKADPICTNQTITLTKTPEASGGMNGDNLFANSFMAPIDVKNFTPDDFSDYGTGREDIVKTFYIFNSGSWNQWNGQNEKDSTLGSNGSTTPGQYCAIPALSAKYLDSEYDITTIPPMQGVYVIANKDGVSIRLDYNKHIWQAGTSTDASTNLNEPMRAPQRQAQEQMQQDSFRRLRLQVNSANSGADRMYIIQESTTTRDYDNGYDAPNQFAEGIANIYTTEPFGKMEVSCANNIDSMYIGFQAGADNYYTLSFRSLIGDSLYLKDMEQNTIIRMEEGAEYCFSATPFTTNDLRFQLLLHPQWEADNTPTQVDQVQLMDIWNDNTRLYITNAPTNSIATIYTISGQPILHSTIQYTTHTIDIHHLPQGVYILRINNQIYKFVCQ